MTIAEIFADINAHKITGMMIHSQMAEMYCYLGFKGYAKMHEYHYLEEAKQQYKINKHFIKHHNMLIDIQHPGTPDVVPKDWYGVKNSDVSFSSRKRYVEQGFQKWADWESSVIHKLQGHYSEAIAHNEVADAEFIKCLIEDATEELHCCLGIHTRLKMVDYDIKCILDDQERYYNVYCNKIKV